jgi:hypothetical protein
MQSFVRHQAAERFGARVYNAEFNALGQTPPVSDVR